MIDAIAGLYGTHYAGTLVYMLQSTEYRAGPYLRWYWRTNNFSRVANRKVLEHTRVAKLLQLALGVGMLIQIGLGVTLVVLGLQGHMVAGTEFGIALLISYPVVWAHLVVVPLELGRWLIITPKESRLVIESHAIFSKHPGTKIAVAGSYGKTSMKELLLTVLEGARKVAATPANKNVAVSHAAFAKTLKGDEDIVIIEYGEGSPGDVQRFANTTQPNIGIITGLAPAHLDKYKTLQAAGKDIFSLADFLQDQNVYVNGESPDAKEFIKPSHHVYSTKGILGWEVSNIRVSLSGTSFTMKKGNRVLNLKSSLIGRHQIGPIALAAAIADKLKLTKKHIESAVARTLPFEHRMQPYSLAGAWVIDDTYNGNLEGIKAGLALLGELSGQRKVYVTPGLVDQGKETQRVHLEIGKLIAQAHPDRVVLMQNSVTKWIEQGLTRAGFKGDLSVEKDPLRFYTNIDQFVAVGDIVLMQNDWTDNYW
jgi:UDP-N-acetylmuramoyl-tripeptide--D-alanyl-D-alanine ligase